MYAGTSRITPNFCKTRGERWVVIVTTQKPTKIINQLIKLPDWNIVVIGDKSTPANWGEEIRAANLVFVSYEEQVKLPFAITKLIPANNYDRKNIGYLYAISCGAKKIYDFFKQRPMRSKAGRSGQMREELHS